MYFLWDSFDIHVYTYDKNIFLLFVTCYLSSTTGLAA